MFVHFGLYSVLGKGEWAKHILQIPDEEYEALTEKFNPDGDWAEKLTATAKQAGCRYITLTTRHHDGFSLYDTCGLSDYDARHVCGRDLVREFVDACRKEGLIPFFYHTLLDWHEASYCNDFPAYLIYLRKSVEVLCTNYGTIGGLWFDGMWDKWDADWEEDALYGCIRKHQPQAMIINNTGLDKLGGLGHVELDSVTFERGRPTPINMEGAPKYIASEMCQVLADHWGYADEDFHYKAPGEIIQDLASCRRYGSNFLLNVGPMGNGLIRPIDKEIYALLGRWVEMHKKAIYDVRPAGIPVEGKDSDFILQRGNVYYLFCSNLPMSADANVHKDGGNSDYEDRFALDKKITSVSWLDNGEEVSFHQDGGRVRVDLVPFQYGRQLVVRIAKIVTE